MFRDVVTRSTTADEWPRLRLEIHDRILASMGRPARQPGLDAPSHVVSTCTEYGLRRDSITIEVLPGLHCAGYIYHPLATTAGVRLPGAVCIHGTNRELASKAVASPELHPDAAYAIELAAAGHVAITVDQFGFGAWTAGITEAELYRRFFAQHPEWSLDGMRLHIQRCAVSVLQRHRLADPTRILCIGNSLGGRAAIHLAAFDPRVGAAIVSTGVSPNISNVFRNGSTDPCSALSSLLNAALAEHGKAPWEYEEMLALVAPRTLILLEPFNDPYNPHVEATVECFLRARRVYEVLGAARNLTLLCHGRGHATPVEMRRYAYDAAALAGSLPPAAER